MQDEVRNQGIEGGFVDGECYGQTIVETRLLDLGVLTNEFNLLSQRDLLGVLTAQARSQQFAKPRHNALRRLRIFMDQFNDGVQRI